MIDDFVFMLLFILLKDSSLSKDAFGMQSYLGIYFLFQLLQHRSVFMVLSSCTFAQYHL